MANADFSYIQGTIHSPPPNATPTAMVSGVQMYMAGRTGCETKYIMKLWNDYDVWRVYSGCCTNICKSENALLLTKVCVFCDDPLYIAYISFLQ